jgi:hypothetical protein
LSKNFFIYFLNREILSSSISQIVLSIVNIKTIYRISQYFSGVFHYFQSFNLILMQRIDIVIICFVFKLMWVTMLTSLKIVETLFFVKLIMNRRFFSEIFRCFRNLFVVFGVSFFEVKLYVWLIKLIWGPFLSF